MMLATDVRSIVFERLLPGAAFLGMALLGIAAQDASTGLEWARVFANGGFMGLIGDLFLIRLPRAGERAPLSGALAGLAGTLAPVALSVSPITENEILLATGTTLTVIGLLASVVAVASLGRCFGIFPEARGLVTHGLYRWSRHPVYLGEYIAVGGIVLSSLSVIANRDLPLLRRVAGAARVERGASVDRRIPRVQPVRRSHKPHRPVRLVAAGVATDRSGSGFVPPRTLRSQSRRRGISDRRPRCRLPGCSRTIRSSLVTLSVASSALCRHPFSDPRTCSGPAFVGAEHIRTDPIRLPGSPCLALLASIASAPDPL